MQELGLGDLSLERSRPTLSPGELQRLRLATQLGSRLFGVIYVRDEPAAGMHAADVDRLMAQLQRLVDEGSTVVVVELEMRVVAQSDWVIDMGPGWRTVSQPAAERQRAACRRATRVPALAAPGALCHDRPP